MNISVFYAHSSSASEEEIKAGMHKVRQLIAEKYQRVGTTTTVKATSGKQAWTEGFNPSMQGDYSSRMNTAWARWAGSVCREKDRVTGKARYDIFICPDLFCGAATQVILEGALKAGRAVFYFDGLKFHIVTSVLCCDANNYRAGYQLYLVTQDSFMGGI